MASMLIPRRRALSSVTIARLTLVAATVLAGSSTVASKFALEDIPPISLAFGRFAIAAVVLVALCQRTSTRPAFGWGPLALGITGVTIAFAFQNIGLQFTSVGTATIIIEGSVPVATSAFGIMLLRERISLRQMIGMTLAVAGVASTLLLGTGASMDFSPIGGGLTLVAGLSFALYTVVGRRIFGTGLSIPIVTGSVIMGTALLAPIALVEFLLSPRGDVTGSGMSALVFLGVGGSALVHLLWARGLCDLSANEVAILGTLMPVVAMLCATVFLGEPVTRALVIGGLLIALGLVFFIERERTVQPPIAAIVPFEPDLSSRPETVAA